jgi:hypothetical protein
MESEIEFIIVSTHWRYMAGHVQEHLEKGWELHGDFHLDRDVGIQAMTRKKKSTEEDK